MTQRTFRRRPLTQRRENIFVTSNLLFTLLAADTGVPDQRVTTSLDTAIEARLGRNLTKGDTVSRIWVNGFWGTDADVTAPAGATYSFGVGFFPFATDAGDFPDLAAHDGPWMLHDQRPLTEQAGQGSLAARPLLPFELSSLQLDNRSQRTVRSSDDRLFAVVQKTAATEEIVSLQVAVTVMGSLGVDSSWYTGDASRLACARL